MKGQRIRFIYDMRTVFLQTHTKHFRTILFKNLGRIVEHDIIFGFSNIREVN